MNLKKQPVILVDMDDVLAEFTEEWLRRYNEDYDDTITAEVFDGWDAVNSVKPECGVNILDYFKAPGIYRHLKPKAGSQAVMQELIDLGAEVMIVTDSPMGCTFGGQDWKGSNPTDDKRAWLMEHFPMIPVENVIVARKKWFVIGDVLIDDKPATIEKFQEMNRKIIAMEMPYNRKTPARLRAKTWEDVREILLREFYPELEVAVGSNG